STTPADPARLPPPYGRRPPRREPRVGESRQRGLTANAPAARNPPRARPARLAHFSDRERSVTFTDGNAAGSRTLGLPGGRPPHHRAPSADQAARGQLRADDPADRPGRLRQDHARASVG